MATQLIAGGRVATANGVLDPGWVLVEDGSISEVGAGDPPERSEHAERTEAGGAWVVPGFVDIHCHGGGGAAFTDPAQVRHAVEAHRRHGTTTMLASLVSRPVDELVEQVAALREFVQQHRLSFPIVPANEDIAGIYNIVYRFLFDRHRDLTLPTSFLINEKGEIVKIYQGSLNLQQVEDAEMHRRGVRGDPVAAVGEEILLVARQGGDRTHEQKHADCGDQNHDQDSRALGQAVKQPVATTRFGVAPRQESGPRRLKRSCGDDLTRTGIGWVWRCHCVPINQKLVATTQSA